MTSVDAYTGPAAEKRRGGAGFWTVAFGAGAGAVFKGTTGVVLETSGPENRLAMISNLLIALFVGLSVPVIGAGVALNEGASAPNTVLWFAIVVALGVSLSGWALLGRRPRGSDQAA